MNVIAEYIWIDGIEPTKKLRSKTQILELDAKKTPIFPKWSFDGSSTNQCYGNNSDCLLNPVRVYLNPLNNFQNYTSYLVFCEVLNSDGTTHKTNTRKALLDILNDGANDLDSWFGFEQEYVFFKNGNIIGWPVNAFPAPQGLYYCGVGADEVVGREIVEEHLKACLEAKIMIKGINAEVMLGQWEFQIGPRNMLNITNVDPLKISDDLWMARWLLYRIGEKYNVYATLDPKPRKGDWNGSGMHCNFSTKQMRENGNKKMFQQIVDRLSKNHKRCMDVYGYGNKERMTGKHETAKFDQFTWGNPKNNITGLIGSRSSSVRVPPTTSENWKGYLEDRRPAANADPYEICSVILQLISDLH